MIRITINHEAGTARAAAGTVIKAAGAVPVVLDFTSNPGGVSSIALALSTDSSAPDVLAYLDAFERENSTTYTGTLDASDPRLQAVFTGKKTATVDVELVVTLTGQAPRVYPNFPITAQKPAITGPQSSETGPVYPTDAPQDGKAYVRRDGVWVEVEHPDPYVPAYILRAASFEAAPGKSYAADTSARETIPPVLPTVTARGLVFTGETWDVVRSIAFNDWGGFGEGWVEGEYFLWGYEGGVTTLADIVAIFPLAGIRCELAPGASGGDLLSGDIEAGLYGGEPPRDAPIPFEVTLPAAPAPGDVIAFADAQNTWGSNPITILRGGAKIEGAGANFSNSAAGTFFSLLYIDATVGWRVLASGTRPMNLVAPVIIGGYTRRASTGEWTGSPSGFAWQWQHSGDGVTGWADITGATSRSFVPKDFVGDYLRVAVTATNANGVSAPAYSAATEAIPDLPGLPHAEDALMWFDAADGATMFDAATGGAAVAEDGAVARWEDKSWHGHHVTQSIEGARPILKEDVLNGLPGVLFDGADDYLQNPLEIHQGATVCAVFRPETAPAEMGMIIESYAVNLFRVPGGAIKAYGGAFLATGSTSLHAPYLVTLVLDGATSMIRINGGEGTTGTTGGSLTGAGNFAIAKWKDGGECHGMYLFELAVFDSVLTGGEISEVEAFLMTKWGLE